MNALKRVLTFSIILIGIACHAEDVISLTNGRSLSAIVTEITSNEVKYKKSDNPNGPTYVTSKSDVKQIQYENGYVDVFNQETTTTAPSGPTPKATTTASPAGNIFGTSDYTGHNTSNRVSDAMLMKQYTIDQANKIKKRGKIGGWCLIGVGVATFLGFVINEEAQDIGGEQSTFEYCVGGVLSSCIIIGGGVWMYCANRKAKKMIESVNYLTLIEHDLITTPNGNLTAGLDIIKSSNFVPSNGVGVSFKYNF